MVQGQHRQKKSLQDLISINDWVQWFVPVIPAMWGITNSRIMVQPALGIIKQDAISKITYAK
jgi:hypothetical protein